MSKNDPEQPNRLALIASKGTLDWAYPPFILASTAGAMGWDVGIFFTFYGLPLLLKECDQMVSPLGNPAMPMKMPFGPEAFQKINWPIPTALMAAPGFNNLATTLMKQTFKNKGVNLRDSGFHAALGRSYLVTGDRARAVASYRKAVALDPSNQTAFAALAQLDQ